MATTVARLEAILSAQTRDFDRAMDKSDRTMHKVGKTATRAGLVIAGGLAVGLEKSVHAALGAQVAQARLDVAFKTSGLSAKKYAGQVSGLESQGRKLGFTNDDTRKSLGSLLVATHSMTKSSKDLAVAQDIARFKGIDLTASTKMLTMAMGGSQRAVKQLGIDVPRVTLAQDALKRSGEDLTTVQGRLDLAHAKLIDKQRTAALVIDTVRQKVQGQADAFSKTAAGSLQVFNAQINNLEESMGQGLLPAIIKVSDAVAVASSYFAKNHTQAKILTIALGVLAGALLAARTAQILMNLAVLANPYVAAAVALAALSAALVILWRRYEAARIVIQAVVALTGGALAVAIYQAIKNWGALSAAIQPAIVAVHGINSAISHTVEWLKSAVGWVKTLVDWLGKIHVPHIPFTGGGGGGGGGKALTSNDKQMLSNTVPQVKNAVEVARENGWTGSITSGFRTYAQQAADYQRYLNGGPLAAKPGTSSHEFGRAVDVTDYGTFGGIMSHATPAARLYNRLGAADPVHYSVSGYARGGVAGKRGTELATLGENGPEVVTPLGGLKGGTWQDKYFDFMQRVWSFARPYFPNALGPMPPVTFTTGLDSLFVGTDFTPDAKGHVPAAGRRMMYWPKWLNFFAGGKKALAPFLTLIHEWAHEFQSMKQTNSFRLSEGGAEAFTEAFAPSIYRGLGFNISPSEIHGDTYPVATNWVRRNKGMDWISRGQFGVFDNGGWLQPGLTMAYNGTGQPERVGGGNITIPISLGGEHVATVVFDMLRRKAKVFENRNGRPAFGGA